MNEKQKSGKDVFKVAGFLIALCSLIFGPNFYQQITSHSIFQLFYSPTATAQNVIVVDFLGYKQFREPNPADVSPTSCKEANDFLDVFSFIAVNNDMTVPVSLYKLDTTFKIGTVFFDDEDLSAAPLYSLSLPISEPILDSIIKDNNYEPPRAYAILNQYLYDIGTTTTPCAPNSTLILPLSITPQSNVSLKIGILYDFTDTAPPDQYPGYWIPPVSSKLKRLTFAFKFSDGSTISIIVP
jgi:hypothetical protein